MKTIMQIGFIVFFLLSSVAFSQIKSKTEANADIVEYTNKEGLPSTNFSNIVQTRDGYIWISGIEGTYRFNGYDFEEVGMDIGLPDMQDMYYDKEKDILYFASPKKFIRFDGKTFEVFTEKDGYKINGLAGQNITFVEADSKGRIWIGSSTPFVDKKFNGGLTKYENGKFTVFDSKTFPLDNARNFIETPYGDIIFNSFGHNTRTLEGSAIALYKNGVFKKIDESMGVSLQGANLITSRVCTSVDKDGNTWIPFSGKRNNANTFVNAGVLMYDGSQFHQYPELNRLLKDDQAPLEVYYSPKLDKLFLTTFSSNIRIFDGNNQFIYEFENGKWKRSNILKQIFPIKNLRTGSEIKDFAFSMAFFVKENRYFPELLVLPSNTTNPIDQQSSLYPDQLFYFANSWKKFDSFQGNYYIVINNGVVFSSGRGLGFYYPNASKMLTPKDGLLMSQNNIPNLFTDQNGIVWLTYSYSDLPDYAQTENAGVNVWDGTRLRSITEKDGLASNITFNTFQDSNKNIWLPTSKGLTIIREIKNSSDEQIFKLNNVPRETGKPYNVSSVLETRNGDIYSWENYVRPAAKNLIAADYFLGKYDGNKIVKIMSPFDETDNNKKYQLFDLQEDNDGRLWFFGLFADNIKDITSTQSKIMIYDGRSWRKPPAGWNIPNEQLHFVGTLKNGMYFLTVGGFYVFNGNRFISLSDSVSATADFRILKGASVAGTQTEIHAGGHLYIRLRNKGLVIFDGTNLNFYTKKDGLLSTNLSNPIMDDFRGFTYFSSPAGALKIDGNQFQTFYNDESIASGGPSTSIMDGFGNMVEYYNGLGLYIDKSIEKSYPLKISSVSVNGKSHYYNLPVDFPHSDNSFVFNYAALNFQDPKQTTYEHFLEGYDKSWSRSSVLPFAEYQNLPFGEYTFKVRGITSNGIQTNEATWSFVINPPLWRTWWAYMGYLLIIGLALIGVRKMELDRRRQRENKRLLELENERKSKELEEAKQFQLSMLPKVLPKLPHLDIAVYMKTATEVGGDYYDFHVHPDGTLTVILGDATGHGMMSGMMVSIMKSLFMSDRSNKELKPFFNRASEAIKDMELGRLMMALTCVQISNNKLMTTNAGMPSLVIYRSKKQLIEEISVNNMPLGAMRNVDYEVKEITIERGDTLLLMSDGFPEMKNVEGEMYGYRRARNSFEEAARKEPEEIVNFLNDEGLQWTGDSELEDDITFVVIKVK